MNRIWRHLSNWAEAYLWLPLFLLSLIGAGLFVQGLTGRPVRENVDWLVDYSSVSIKCALMILFTSFFKQATGSWLTKEEKFAHPGLALVDAIKILVSFLVFAYVFTH